MAHEDPLGGSNLPYVEALYARYLDDPESVGEDWRSWFAEQEPDGGRAVPAPSFRPSSLFRPPGGDAGPRRERLRDVELPELEAGVLEHRLELLRGSRIFRHLPDDELRRVARLATEENLEDGTYLFHEGEAGDCLHLVTEGTLVVRRRDDQVVRIRTGEVVGELAIFSALPRIADVVAQGSVRVLRLGRDDLMALIDQRPALARGFLATLARRLRRDQSRQDKVNQLVHAYRVRGHLLARLDPLGPPPASSQASAELEPSFYGLDDDDLDRLFSSTMIPGTTTMTLGQILERLRATYCRSVGVQFMHIDDLRAKRWLHERLEDPRHHRKLSRDEQLRIFTKLADAELFERFIHSKFLGAKRFSLEGAETLIPLLDLTLDEAERQGVREVVVGMAHRGRLNVLVNILGKSPREVFREFADADPEMMLGRGDVKYHLGYSSDRASAGGGSIHLSMCFNPSHLEFVNPVLLGRVRAKQDRFDDREHRQGLGVLIHGDAAFAGQGVVQEHLNMSDLTGYRTGGTVHVIVNNQIGFTTSPEAGRSTSYATEVARMLQTPIFHVNGEDPEAVAHVVRIAMDYRREFQKDIILDMYCYRRHGHNEGDEPSYTQPRLYAAIRERKSVREGYLDHLLKLDGVTREETDQIAARQKEKLEEELERSKAADYERRGPSTGEGIWQGYQGGADNDAPEVSTAVESKRLAELLRATTRVPDGFHLHPKLEKFMERRREMASGERPLDWSAGEALALASLVVEGRPVRLSGQDSGRGTFSHRHAVLHDTENGEPWVPLAHLTEDQARMQIYDSPLSEIGVLGFEYGYSLDTPEGLIAWEAQFGDFCNVAQVIIDQFITSGEDKWRRLSGLVLLLPHGFEGQGPEHSSARLERFLNMAAEDNIQVVNLTTPAQLFHCLRRQVVRPWRKPLVVMSPKSLLRHSEAVSSLDELAQGSFRRILPDTSGTDPAKAKKVILTSGKLYYELDAARREAEREDLAILRLEQYYPLAKETLDEALAPYADATPLVWVQEEPSNMGALPWLRLRLPELLGDRPFSWVSRPESASPATGSAAAHKKEQKELLDQALE